MGEYPIFFQKSQFQFIFSNFRKSKGLSIKDVRSQKGGGLSNANKKGGELRTFWRNFGFFEIYGVSERTEGGEPVRTFFGQGAGSILRDFVGTSCLLRTAPCACSVSYVYLTTNVH